MSVFDNPAFDGHERVVFFYDAASGLKAIIALHSTTLGPAAGGCRVWSYASDEEATTDALRLSRGMSFKNAMANLGLGGGKAVIMIPEGATLTTEMLEAFGRFVDSLDGSYITAEDVGMSVRAMQSVATQTRFVAGLPAEDGVAGGDPSPKTAYGVYRGMVDVLREKLGRSSMEGVSVAVQGVGNVGYFLCEYLSDAGCNLFVADIDDARVGRVCDQFGATATTLDDILFQDVDVVAPCALGAILNKDSIPKISAKLVAGAANNQLATDADGERLRSRGVLYCPDYVINAGGIISCGIEYEGSADAAEVDRQIEAIGPRLLQIFANAEERKLATNVVTDEMAQAIIESHRA